MRYALAPLLIAALLGTPSAQAQLFHPETAILDNGLQVVVLPNHRAPVITQMVWIKSGGTSDPWGVSGVAHFLEHLLFKGTKTRADGEYSKIISRMGGTENAMTSYDYTAYYASFGAQNLETVMQLEADRFTNWQVTDAQIAAERDVILKERQQTTDNRPVSRFWESVGAMLYPNHPYQRPVIGWRAEMEKLDHKAANDFYRTYYNPRNAILVLSGDITLDKALPLARKYFGPIAGHDLPARLNTDIPPLDGTKHLQMTSPLVKETIWSQHYLVAPVRPETIAKSDALLILSKILGDGRTGRLYRRLVVRDKIATSADVGFDPVTFGPSRWSILVTPEPTTDLRKIDATVQEEIARLLKDGVTDAEVKNATQGLEIETTYARDAVTGPAMIVGEALVSELDLATIESWPQRMRNVTKEAVMQAAKELLSQQPRLTAVLLPEKEAKK
jgi:zinc protease